MSVKVIILAAFVALVSCQRRQGDFGDIDLNANGVLSVTEVEAYCNILDTNRDGSITYYEFSLYNLTLAQNSMMRSQFAFYDNISGVKDDRIICRDDSFTFFGKLDANSDGKITLQEFTDEVAKLNAVIDAKNPPVGK
eukprot:GHVL01008471.1.p1 GENE.GHVL01008471.1~~GHVL01008471.1.p1  ORF type:complete len:138 (+),score=6.20 GHVL01008471.1:88-501(+)